MDGKRKQTCSRCGYTGIEIYLDGELAFASGNIGYYDCENFILDISGAGSVRIVCTTDTNAQGYCVMTAALF